MAGRERPEVVATRMTASEKALVRLAAIKEGLSVSEMLHRIVVPEVRERLLRDLKHDSKEKMAGAGSGR